MELLAQVSAVCAHTEYSCASFLPCNRAVIAHTAEQGWRQTVRRPSASTVGIHDLDQWTENTGPSHLVLVKTDTGIAINADDHAPPARSTHRYDADDSLCRFNKIEMVVASQYLRQYFLEPFINVLGQNGKPAAKPSGSASQVLTAARTASEAPNTQTCSLTGFGAALGIGRQNSGIGLRLFREDFRIDFPAPAWADPPTLSLSRRYVAPNWVKRGLVTCGALPSPNKIGTSALSSSSLVMKSSQRSWIFEIHQPHIHRLHW